eukprot:950139-Amphidinium_carterae.1
MVPPPLCFWVRWTELPALSWLSWGRGCGLPLLWSGVESGAWGHGTFGRSVKTLGFVVWGSHCKG